MAKWLAGIGKLTLTTALSCSSSQLLTKSDGLPIVDPPERVAGYFKLNRTYDAHMFYFFYESRSKGPNDPVILWMTGESGVCAMSITVSSIFLHLLAADSSTLHVAAAAAAWLVNRSVPHLQGKPGLP